MLVHQAAIGSCSVSHNTEFVPPFHKVSRMKFLVVLLVVAGVCTANKTPLRTRGRVDGLPRAPININLDDGGFTATSILEATCTGNTAALTLAVTDVDDELEKSSISVGAGGAGCSIEGSGETVSLDLATNACGRDELVEPAKTVYTWQVRVDHYPAPAGVVAFKPLSSNHVITCEIAITDPAAVSNPQPAAITGENVAENSAAIQLSLVKLPSSTNRLWQLTVAPSDINAVPAGLSYRLTTCTATPTDAETPTLALIAAGCITPKTGTRASYTSANKQYELTVRAFGFSGVDGEIAIQCNAVLCAPVEGTELCAEQLEGPLPVCVAEVPEETGRVNKALSQLPNKLVRRVRSANQYITSNVLAL